MIIVSRLNGVRFSINAEHLERVEETPDTVITLLDGRKYIICESMEEVIDLVVAYRANVLRISYVPADPDRFQEPPLRLVDRDLIEDEGAENGSPVGPTSGRH